MSCEIYCNWSSTHMEIAPLKIQVNIDFINEGITICGILVLLLVIVVIICYFRNKCWYILLFFPKSFIFLIKNTTCLVLFIKEVVSFRWWDLHCSSKSTTLTTSFFQPILVDGSIKHHANIRDICKYNSY